MNALVYSSSLAASFLGGIVALFAPCCIVSLLPMFVGAALQRGRAQLPVTTGLFAAGVAVVLLPVVLGVGALGQLFAAHHRIVYLLVGTFLVFLGVLTLAGRRWMLPMPELSLRTAGSGPGTVFVLGVTAGIASSCCAPVLAGVVAMSALAASIAGALGLGLTYVFGMVFPLMLAALLWERLRLDERLPSGARAPRLRLGGRAIPWTDAVAGAMFLGVGSIALALAATGRSTYTPDALAAWNRWAIGAAADLAAALQGVPVAGQALLLAVLAAVLGTAVYSASRRERTVRPRREPAVPDGAGARAARGLPSAAMGTAAGAGLAAAAILLGFYFGVLTTVSGWPFTVRQFGAYWPFLVALAIGFGIQVGMFFYLRRAVRAAALGTVMVATGATSGAAMVSCCTHYLVNLLPVLGATGLVGFIGAYQVGLFWFGIASNVAGIAYIGRRVVAVARGAY